MLVNVGFEDIQNPDPNIPGRVQNYNQYLQLSRRLLLPRQGRGRGWLWRRTPTASDSRSSHSPTQYQYRQQRASCGPNAYLAIVLITDEDDCSANNDNGKNDDMFDIGDQARRGRHHQPAMCSAAVTCAAATQFQPTTRRSATRARTPFSHTFTDLLGQGSGRPQIIQDHVYLPLYDVQEMIDSVNWTKGAQAGKKNPRVWHHRLASGPERHEPPDRPSNQPQLPD